MSHPSVSVLIPTYNRPWILRETISLLQKNLKYSGQITYYIGIDGDLSIGKMFAGHSDIVSIPGPNNGLGANINRLINSTKDDYLFQMDDDHHLLDELDLDPHIRQLEFDSNAGWIRLMGVAYHDYIAKLKGDYWYIYWESPELYITSNRPHLKHRRFHDYYGLYPEGVKLGESEVGFCEQCKTKAGSIKVLVPVNEIKWNHVGDSWQLKGK